MRFLAALAALLFLYLALIPAGLIYSTLDSACAGAGCETSVASRVFFTTLYALCLAAVLGTAGLFAHYAASGTVEAQYRLPRALGVTGGVIGSALFVLFFAAFPLGGTVALAIAAGTFLALWFRGGDRESAPGPPPLAEVEGRNGHNGNGFKLPD